MTDGRTPGVWLDVPSNSGRHGIAFLSHDQVAFAGALHADIFEDAVYTGQSIFVALGYEDADTVYATLYQIAPNGGLSWSECFPIAGPEAE